MDRYDYVGVSFNTRHCAKWSASRVFHGERLCRDSRDAIDPDFLSFFFFLLSRSSTDYRVNFQRDVVRWSFTIVSINLILYIFEKKREESNTSMRIRIFNLIGLAFSYIVAHNSWKGKSRDHPDNDPPGKWKCQALGPCSSQLRGLYSSARLRRATATRWDYSKSIHDPSWIFIYFHRDENISSPATLLIKEGSWIKGGSCSFFSTRTTKLIFHLRNELNFPDRCLIDRKYLIKRNFVEKNFYVVINSLPVMKCI